MVGGVMRLRTKGMLEMGEVPSPPLVISAIPAAQIGTPQKTWNTAGPRPFQSSCRLKS